MSFNMTDRYVSQFLNKTRGYGVVCTFNFMIDRYVSQFYMRILNRLINSVTFW